MASTGEIRAKLTLDASQFNSTLSGVHNQISSTMSGVSKSLGSIGSGMKSFGNDMSSLGSSIVKAFTPVATALVGSVKCFEDYETAMVHLKRTSGMTGDELDAFKSKSAELSNELGISETAFTELAAQVAAYGIKGTDSITEVVKVAQMMGESFEGIDVSKAISQVAKFAYVMGLSEDEMGNYGSAVAMAEDNSAALAGEILNVNNRVAATAKSFGLSADEVTAYSAILLSSGLTAETAGTNFQKFMGRVQRASAQGGKDIETFASVAGMSVGGFNTLLKMDGSKAIEVFCKGLANLEKNGGNVDGVLQDLKINGQGEIRVVKSLMEAYKNTNGEISNAEKMMKILNEAYNDGSKLTSDYADIQDTLKFKVQSVKANIVDLGTTIGTALEPALKGVADSFNELILKVTEFVQKNPELIQQFALTVVKGMAVGASLVVVGKAISTVGTVVTGVSKIFSLLSSAISLLLSPIGLVIVAIGALVGCFVYCWNEVDGFKERAIGAFDHLWTSISNFCSKVWTTMCDVWDNVKGYVIPVVEQLGETIVSLIDCAGGLFDALGAVWDNIGPKVTGWLTVIIGAVSWFAEHILIGLEGAFVILKELLEGDVAGAFDAAWEYGVKLIDHLWKGIKDGLGNLANKICQLWNPFFDEAEEIAKVYKENGMKITQEVVEHYKKIGIDLSKYAEDTKQKVGYNVNAMKDNMVTKMKEMGLTSTQSFREIAESGKLTESMSSMVISNFDSMLTGIQYANDGAKGSTLAAWADIKQSIADNAGQITPEIAAKMDELLSNIQYGNDAAKADFEDKYSAIKGIVVNGMEQTATEGSNAYGKLQDYLADKNPELLSMLDTFMSDFGSTMGTGMDGATQEGINNFQLPPELQQLLSEVEQQTGIDMSEITNTVGTGMGNASDKAVEEWGKTPESIANTNKAIEENMSTTVTNVSNHVDTLVKNISNGFDSISKTITDSGNKIITDITSAWDKVGSTLLSSINKAKDTVSTGFKGMSSSIATEMTRIVSTISNKMTTMTSQLISSINRIKTAFNSGWTAIGNQVISIVTRMVSQVISTLNQLPPQGINAVNRLRSGMLSAFNACVSDAYSTASRIKAAFEGMHIRIPRPSLPYISVSKDTYAVADGCTVNVPRFSVSWYAKGGYFDGASVIGVGEAGKEVVLPLENKRNMKPFANAVSDNLRNDGGSAAQAVVINNYITNNVNGEQDIRKLSEKITTYTEREMRRRGIITGNPKRNNR